MDFIVTDKTAPSGVALIFVAKDGENSLAVAGGANSRLAPADVKKATKVIRGADMLVAQLESPLEAISSAAAIAAKAGVPFILNPAPARALPDELLKLVTILTPNQTEAEYLTGIKVKDATTAAKAAAKLLPRGVGDRSTDTWRRWCLHSGCKRCAAGTWLQGCCCGHYRSRGHLQRRPGGGDRRGKPLPNAAAALSVTRLGAQRSAPTRREIEKLLKNHP